MTAPTRPETIGDLYARRLLADRQSMAKAILSAEAARHERVPARPLLPLRFEIWRERLLGTYSARAFIRTYPPGFSILSGRDGYLEIWR